MKKAVVVLSGGLDSTTCMGLAQEAGYKLLSLTFYYGQRHHRELACAHEVARYYQAEHREVAVDFLQTIGGSALTDANIPVPNGGEEKGIPSTYVPARNLIFLSLAAAYAETQGAEAIYIGVSAVDFSGYPDCRPAFIRSMEETVNLATRAGHTGTRLRMIAPLIHLSKAETIREGLRLQVPYHLTTSCYRGEKLACGRCDSCRLRLKGFAAAGVEDPIPYRRIG